MYTVLCRKVRVVPKENKIVNRNESSNKNNPIGQLRQTPFKQSRPCRLRPRGGFRLGGKVGKIRLFGAKEKEKSEEEIKNGLPIGEPFLVILILDKECFGR